MIAQIKKEQNTPVQKEAQSVASVYNKNNNTLADPERIEELWVRFSRSIANTNTHLYSLMQKMPIIEGNKIYMTVSSELQAEKVHESSELIDFIRKQTGINSIEIITNIDESINANSVENRVYTPKQKLDYIKKHNDSIEYLIKSLSLDIS